MSKRFRIEIPPDLERSLILWAHVRGNKLLKWVVTVLYMSVATYRDSVDKDLQTQADLIGISKDDLINRILTKAGYDFGRALIELETDPSDQSED
jgi:hypothetical protein